MILKKLLIKNFRNYRKLSVTFSPRLNYIYGNNAQGKSSLLEAISILFTGRSFRSNYTKELICHGCSHFTIQAIFEKNNITHTLQISSNGKQRKMLFNHKPCRSLKEMFGIVQGVTLSPQDHNLIMGAPSVRRHFLDLQITQIRPSYIEHLCRYQKSMKQRNALLKRKEKNQCPLWEKQMAKSAAFISKIRYETIEDLLERSSHTQSILSLNQDCLSLKYKSQVSYCEDPKTIEQAYLTLYEKYRTRELDMGSSLVGPHKDNLEIFIGKAEAKLFSSEGQQRSCAAALRLSQWHRIKDLSKDTPIMSVDDIHTSLDHHRKEKFMQLLDSLGQVFITTAHPPSSKIQLEKNSCFLRVENGKVFSC